MKLASYNPNLKFVLYEVWKVLVLIQQDFSKTSNGVGILTLKSFTQNFNHIYAKHRMCQKPPYENGQFLE